MERKPITPFAISAKQSLVNLNKPQIWLENEIANDTGLYVDSGVLYKIWTGKSKSKKNHHFHLWHFEFTVAN